MIQTQFQRSSQILHNKEEYGFAYDSMSFMGAEAAANAQIRRDCLLAKILQFPESELIFSDTKLSTGVLSPGCRLCAQGDWSCLFINNICNATCFFCPSTQNAQVQPMSNSIEFRTPKEYADYVRIFGIKGVSFSGGEPFISFDRVLLFLKTLRTQISHPLYIWMYTNGILADSDKFKTLADNGLDEIRFDLSAVGYNLNGIRKALGVIPRVVVEIPAIPEDLIKTKELVHILYEEGVQHLNLHQIRCTQFNLPRLAQRGYTFVHGPKVTVLETELAALELILHCLENQIALPVNYCSFTYRHQFQRAGALRRAAGQIKAGHEDITENGYIRALSFLGSPGTMDTLHQQLPSQVKDQRLFEMKKTKDQLFFSAALLPDIDLTAIYGSDLHLKIAYYSAVLKPSVSFRHAFKEVFLNKKKKVVVERQVREKGIVLIKDQIPAYIKGISNWPKSPPDWNNLQADIIERILPFEQFEQGLALYY